MPPALEQADIVQAVVAELAPGPVVLIAHDMGTSVTTEPLARDLHGRLLFRAAAHLLISYLDERERYAERWQGAVRDWPKPLNFLWALDDPVATTNVLDGLRELRPAADVVELPGAGHYPQVEVPDVFPAQH